MWIRSKDANGLHSFTVYAEDGSIYAHGDGYACYMECERAAEICQRHALFGFPSTDEKAPASLDDISDEELLALLDA